MRRRLYTAVLLGLGIAAGACRDTTEPFRPTDRRTPPDGPVLRLTYGSADDRAPVWSSGGDSIYFVTSQWEGNPLAPATIVALPANGAGSLTTLLRNVQDGTGRTNWLTAPALSGDRIAFVRVHPLLPDGPCVGTRVCPLMSQLPMVQLRSGELHVRAVGAGNGLPEDIVLPLTFEGYSQEDDPSMPIGVVAVSDYNPAQLQFATQRRSFFRPAWSPDGVRLVVSDGLRLLRWTAGTLDAEPIPGTDDGVTPAWSPDGEWIAYARQQRLSSLTFMCEYQNTFMTPDGPITVTSCTERRTMYSLAAPEIVLVRPDGSGQHVLGAGADPAWSPDGRFVYASREFDGIVRIAVDDGTATPVPNTAFGIEPAVSPDGRRLAFARTHVDGGPSTRDIWIVELP